MSVDSYMNIQLSGTEEYINRKHTGTLGQVLIRYGHDSSCQQCPASLTTNRCNNVLWISAAKGVEMNGDTSDVKMEG